MRPDHLEPVTNTANTRRRDRRFRAATGTKWVHDRSAPDVSAMDQWAKMNGLPFGVPLIAMSSTRLSGYSEEPCLAPY